MIFKEELENLKAVNAIGNYSPSKMGGVKKKPVGDFAVFGSNSAQNSIQQKIQAEELDRKIFQHFKQDLTEKDFENALSEVDLSLKELTKANIMELKSIAKPNPLIEKTMQIVCALRGYKNLNWATARELLGKPSLKIDLKQTTIDNVKAEYIARA
mmetsp:Transcript_29447/g.44606  ORF Transcript_29447/g.44606 Transcript_29447/m.44606 type:complete len:156 (-) Transcript_29447:1040-1507(-)